ncbi:hypothetical protein Q5P01_002401 [Channa striata]|uniref:Uncharacterized protein n=1 Tax=Channa striata TaxID=64152 RepID=A0AA88P0M6_CHASR|nr:hypothetical protein Q5P01_002401 [Channa striata]
MTQRRDKEGEEGGDEEEESGGKRENEGRSGDRFLSERSKYLTGSHTGAHSKRSVLKAGRVSRPTVAHPEGWTRCPGPPQSFGFSRMISSPPQFHEEPV